MDLKKYWQKRDFNKTSEPAGKIKKASSRKKIFIVQKHAASHLHYDFRLELGGVLISWAVPKGPSLNPASKRLAVHVEDHPLEYGKFEGVIPAGEYGAGTVMLWDKGVWEPAVEDPVAAYRQGNLKFFLQGEKLQGKWHLFRINKDDKTWLLCKEADAYAMTNKQMDITQAQPLSVKTGRDLPQIAQAQAHAAKPQNTRPVKSKKKAQPITNMGAAAPARTLAKKAKKTAKHAHAGLKLALPSAAFKADFKPQLATLVATPPEGEGWIHEIKFDGYRFLAYKQGAQVTLISRNGRDWSAKFPSIIKELAALPHKNLVLDGEIVVFDAHHKTDFQLLQQALKEGGAAFYFYLFDLLYVDKYELTQQPLLERKKILAKILNQAKTKQKQSNPACYIVITLSVQVSNCWRKLVP